MKFQLCLLISLLYFSSSSSQSIISKGELWFDSDYSTRINISTPSSADIFYKSDIDVSALENGLHTIHFRFLSDNLWSSPSSSFFLKKDAANVVPLNKIVACQYWYNTDLSTGGQIDLPDEVNSSLDNIIDVSTLNEGLNTIHVRFLDNNSHWSSVVSKFIIKYNSGKLISDNKITGYRYWFNDGEINSGTLKDSIVSLHLFDTLKMQAIEKGEYIVHMQFKDSQNKWSSVIHDTIQKLSFPVARFDYTTDFDCDSSNISFINNSTDGDIYMWNFGDDSTSTSVSPLHTYYTPGTYNVSLMVKDGVLLTDSIIIKSIIIDGIDTSVTVTDKLLTSNELSGSYQWLLNGDVIEGATQQSYSVTQTGNYSVLINKNSCSGMSGSFQFNLTGLDDNLSANDFNIYPNPTDGYITIDLGKDYNDITVKLFNISGRVVSTRNYSGRSRISYFIDGSKGVYFLEISDGNTLRNTARIVKR
jgi:PKD repeat protein